ncbi:hypothetical protein V500_01092 [Pseudogymnoascus sp. VKM F-4518 (FW-2643)]|nr:hypothetical protein V500_01092 [Pseudogymnoascus sp. VKM F-4518 (FW-2643)]
MPPQTFLLLIFLLFTTSTLSETFNIYQLPHYNDARACVQQCLYTVSSKAKASFGCGGTNVATCMCSDNVQQSAAISASCSLCAKSSCSNEPDAQSAAGLFAEFCSVNSGNPAGVVASTAGGAVAAASTENAAGPAITAAPKQTGADVIAPTVTVTVKSDSSAPGIGYMRVVFVLGIWWFCLAVIAV